jgi:signal transduction histidine kinase
MDDRRRTRLRVRLCLLFTSIIALLMVGQALYVSYTTSEASRASQDGVLRRDVERLVGRLVASGSVGETLAEVRAEGQFASVSTLRQFIGADGTVLAESDALRDHGRLLDDEQLGRITPRGVALTIGWRDDRLPARAAVAPTVPPVVVVAMASQDWAGAQRDRLLRFELVIIPLGTLVGAALAWFTVGRQLRRLGGIVRAAMAVAAGDRGGPAEGAAGPKDELFAISAALTEITANLRDALDYQQRFAAQAAHELRTPLAIMKAEADLALSSDSLEETQRALASIGEETEKLGVLVGHLLDFGRTGSAPVPMEAVTPGQLVGAAIQPLGRLASGHGIRLLVDVDDSPLHVSKVGIEHAIRNLVENAIDAAPPGSDVRIAGARQDGWWRLTVEDTGPGVATTVGDSVFEPYVGTRAGGHGLGLAFVKLIAEAHGGRTAMERRPDGTTCFSLAVPVGALSTA